MREVIPGRKRWSQPQRLAGIAIMAGERDLGRATVDLRMQIQEGDRVQERIDGKIVQSFQGIDKPIAAEIRIRAAKPVRDEIGGTTSPLSFYTVSRSDGKSWKACARRPSEGRARSTRM